MNFCILSRRIGGTNGNEFSKEIWSYFGDIFPTIKLLEIPIKLRATRNNFVGSYYTVTAFLQNVLVIARFQFTYHYSNVFVKFTRFYRANSSIKKGL